MGSLSAAPPPPPSGEPTRYISSDELRKHSTPSDLWISIQGKVYDVTAWSSRHPGGDLPLLSLAGHDATDAFLALHPSSARLLLDNFLVAHLSDPHTSPVSTDYRRLLSDFSKAGLFHQKGHTTALTLSAMALFFLTAVYSILFCTNPSAHVAAGVLMGCLWIQSGWIGHDSGHYTVMSSRRFNRIAQILSGNCLTGISIAWWKWNHNAHHIACNSLDYDPDVQHMPIFAISSEQFKSLTSRFYGREMTFDAAARFLVKYQHWTFYPVMCLARINLFAQSILLLILKKEVPNRLQEIVGLLVFWIWYPLLVSFLPNWGERVGFVVVSFAVTGIQHVQFCLNHFSSSVYIGRPGGDDWFEKQTGGSLDIECSPWMDWFHGGLQFQIEHHLFPRLPRRNLRKVAPFVKELCKKHGIEYSMVSFLEANKLTVQTLRTAALQARDLTKPVPKNLVWEAVNTHG